MTSSIPYIGSRMSLISKAEIRYEGFLHEIDTANTTVTLRTVRSFGTEKRRTDKVIPPKDEVFQYIIFRGSDIKDISVCDSPFLDPAIVQSGPASGASSAFPSQNTSLPSASQPTNVSSSPSPANFSAFGMPTTAPQSKPPSAPSPRLFRDISSVPDSRQSPEPVTIERDDQRITNHGRPGSKPSRNQRETGGRDAFGQYSAPRANTNRQYHDQSYYDQQYQYRGYSYNRSYDTGRAYQANTFERGVSYCYGNGGNRNNYQYQTQNANRAYNYQGPTQTNRWSGASYKQYSNQKSGPRSNRSGAQNGQQSAVYEEFDIDDANKKFDKTLLEKEFSTLSVVEGHDHEESTEEDGEAVDATKFYDKAKSFFDNISCDAVEKRTSRLTTAEEKKLNAQTFGVPTVFRNSRQALNSQRGFHNQRRSGNYYGGFSGNANGSNYVRGPGANNYYTSNYSHQNRRNDTANMQSNRRQ